MLDRAVAIAYEAHRGQYDRQGKEYILHPLAVLYNTVTHERYADLSDIDRERVCCIAMLHDVVEDTGVTLEDIRAQIDDEQVVEGVRAMTHFHDEPLEAYWARVKANPLARLVKLGDLKHNTDPGRQVPDPNHRKRLEEKYSRALEFLQYR